MSRPLTFPLRHLYSNQNVDLPQFQMNCQEWEEEQMFHREWAGEQLETQHSLQGNLPHISLADKVFEGEKWNITGYGRLW